MVSPSLARYTTREMFIQLQSKILPDYVHGSYKGGVIPEKFNLKFYFGVFSGLGLVYLIIGPGIID